jgi:acetyl esterase/lipase
MGISAVVLEYTVSDGTAIYPEPQQQALYSLRWLRKNTAKLNIDPDKIAVIGFSAGGHLAACVSHGFDRDEWLLDPDQNLASISARPDASILCYPVLTSELVFAHTGSFKNLLGDQYETPIRETLCWPKNVHAQAPHTFLWHTAVDDCVPVENVYTMAMGLQAQKIPHELHVFPKGDHGIGLGTIGTRRQGSADQWRTLAERWLRELGF